MRSSEKFKISVIVPVYNTDKYIDQCVSSIVNQSYRNLEIILVDDGSYDNSLKKCEIWQKRDKRIKVVHKKNEGVTRARKVGITMATGDYIGFVDSDDYIEKDMYELLINNIIEQDADISHCGYKMIFDDGRVNYFYETGNSVIQDNFAGQKDLLLGEFIEPGLWNKLYKRELFNELEYNENISINEDLLINFLLFRRSKKSIFQDTCMYCYCVRENSATRSNLSKKHILDPIEVKDYIRKMADNKLKGIANKMYLSTCINCYNSIIINGGFNKEKMIIRKKIIKNKDAKKLLNTNRKLMTIMIIYCPFFYKYFYIIYYKYFQIHKYE